MRLLVTALVLLVSADLGAAVRCPGPKALRRLLAVGASGWDVTCRVDERGRALMAAVAPPAGAAPPRLVVAVGLGSARPRRLEVPVTGPEEDAIRAVRADEWSAAVTVDGLGGEEVLRAGVLARTGDEMGQLQEIVAFFRLPRAPTAAPALLWIGLGDRAESRQDVCFLESSATFALTPDGALERTTTGRRLVRGVRRDPEAQRLREECVPPPGRRDLFPLAR